MPQSAKRKSWTHLKRPPPVTNVAVDEAAPITMEQLVPAQVLRSNELDVDALLTELPRQLSHAQLARLLWLNDYWPVFLLTLELHAPIRQRIYVKCLLHLLIQT